MRQRRLLFSIIGIGLLLLLLVLIQIGWLTRMRQMEQQERDVRIVRALTNAGQQLEASVNCFEGYSKLFLPQGDKLYLVHWQRDGGPHGVDTLNIVYNPGSMFPDTAIIQRKGVRFSSPTLAEVQLRFKVPETDSQEHKLQYAGSMDLARPRSYRDLITNKLDVGNLLHTDDADTLLQQSLKDEGINVTGVQYAFSDPARKQLEYVSAGGDGTALLTTRYSIPIFKDNPFIQRRQMSVALIGLQAGNGLPPVWLLVSISIIVLLSLGFYLFVRRYVKQKRLSQLKTEFINNLSHEFNTPMANITLAVETLSEHSGAKDARTERILNILSSETHRLRENIERSLQIATLEQGKLPVHRAPLDLVTLVNTILTGYQSQCAELDGSIAFSHPESALIDGDEVHLLNAICNLLDNAIKYRSGKPNISISIHQTTQEVVLQVADKGIGMSAEVQRHIFDKFYRAQQGNVHNTKGFGLGLNYVKGIVMAHGGTISVRSKPGAGSTFSIHFPKTGHGTL